MIAGTGCASGGSEAYSDSGSREGDGFVEAFNEDPGKAFVSITGSNGRLQCSWFYLSRYSWCGF